MKLTLEMANEKYEVDVEDLDVHELCDKFYDMMVVMGYHPCSIQRGLEEKGEDIKELLCSIREDDY